MRKKSLRSSCFKAFLILSSVTYGLNHGAGAAASDHDATAVSHAPDGLVHGAPQANKLPPVANAITPYEALSDAAAHPERKAQPTATQESADAQRKPDVAAVTTIAGMPPVVDPANIYSETGANMLSPVVAHDPARVYVPNLRSDTVTVIDPQDFKVIQTFKVGRSPQHVVPAWDLRRLWVTNNAEGRTDGSLTPIDPATGQPGAPVQVDDPYNMYFTPDGKYAITVAEARKRLDFRDPHTMALIDSVDTPECAGVNHAGFSGDGRYAIFTCEFGGHLVKVDTVNRKVLGYLKLTKGGMPQDIQTAPDGHRFYVADMWADGVFIVNGDRFEQIGFIPTGIGTHGEYISRDSKMLYVANRGSHKIHGARRGPGNVSVIDLATDKVVKTWPIPGGGSPDMGNVTADGHYLWLSGRFDDEVYAIDTRSGDVRKIKVGLEPHGLTVWPQPGRYSLGHTGILR